MINAHDRFRVGRGIRMDFFLMAGSLPLVSPVFRVRVGWAPPAVSLSGLITHEPNAKGVTIMKMDYEKFMHSAIESGACGGVATLDPVQRLVFLISEAEVLCDMEGIDSFVDKYWPDWGQECIAAFESIGASEIAAGLLVLGDGSSPDETAMDRVNTLITGRVGYGYESICLAIEVGLAKRSGGPLD